jgi:phosphoenolpyruvate carboxykinase (GTP)
MDSNPNAMHSVAKDTIFTNVALTEDGDVWWEDIGYDAPGTLIDWKGNKWNAATAEAPAAHPNARFAAKASNCPAIADNWEDPAGVPIDAFLFGGRRPSTIPLVNEAFDWTHGTFMGSAAGSEITAAALDLKAGTVRRDPMAMRPFIGYHVADFLNHWLKMGQVEGRKLPKIFFTNWFRKNDNGKFIWPGFGDNSRVLEWVFNRCDNAVEAVETPIGLLPRKEDINIEGLDLTDAEMDELLAVDPAGWKAELAAIKETYESYGPKVPAELVAQIAKLEKRLG